MNQVTQEERYYYQEDDLIASGAFSSVFRAYDQQLNRFVALKRIPIRSRQDDSQQQLAQEIQTLKQISQRSGDHTNHLITYYDFFQTQTTYNIVMELVENSISLQNFTENHEVSQRTALELFYQVCQGIKALHSLDIVHRDIKLTNILVNQNTLRVKIVDFGYSKILSNRFEQLYTCAGTPFYMSPQNTKGQGYSGKANDIWSLGIILIQMVKPYSSGQEVINETDPRIASLDFDIKDIVLDCLQQEEVDRSNIEQLIWKVETKLNRNLKTLDSSYKPLPKCDWTEIHSQRPKLTQVYMDLDDLMRIKTKTKKQIK